MDSILFHYVKSAETVALTKTLKNVVTNNNDESTPLSDNQLIDYMKSVWPVEHKDVGDYAQGLPPVAKSDTWDDLLFVMRNIAQGARDSSCFV